MRLNLAQFVMAHPGSVEGMTSQRLIEETMVYPKLKKAIEHVVREHGPIKGSTRLLLIIYLADREYARSHGSQYTEAVYYRANGGVFSHQYLDSLQCCDGIEVVCDGELYRSGSHSQNPLELDPEFREHLDRTAEQWRHVSFGVLMDRVYKDPFFQAADFGDLLRVPIVGEVEGRIKLNSYPLLGKLRELNIVTGENGVGKTVLLGRIFDAAIRRGLKVRCKVREPAYLSENHYDLLLLDEPNCSQHPKTMKRTATDLVELSYSTQIVLTTHSLEFIDMLLTCNTGQKSHRLAQFTLGIKVTARYGPDVYDTRIRFGQDLRDS